ncbi:GlxA family transcriptional regulator [Xinfangfangia sp. CPCC 101601]|uniref:GlxA family transcriptional regulator n=1 Tax=Pseudogemmobacter lacusdianii TaxID=3069608 RepID=A0ABU0VWX5_9RHOB|nr:GlxA family transcriptional regulator [Xinfangfangia sp. CPCC 101601]MDQ2066013.1 GlxA family transcriptional regulator [Xinfangfangia sp. CPCC 101601]
MSNVIDAGDRRYVARGIAHISLQAPKEPINVSFVLMHQFTMLAFTSAIEPLRVANQLAGQVLFRWNVYSADGKPVRCSNGLSLVPDAALPNHAAPGYVLVCGGVEPELACSSTLSDWIRAQWRHGRTVGGLCTGAYALARAGILDGRRFTLHWENIRSFTEVFPDLTPEWQVFSVDDRIVTCAGGVAAADLVLRIVDEHFGGELSQAVMNMCLLSRRRDEADEQTTSLSSRLGTRNRHLAKAVTYLEEHIEEPFSIDDCADHVGVSRRQIERLFKGNLGVTPLQYLNNLRLQNGRALLAETDLSVLETAIACGYQSSSHFSKSFRKKFGVSPHRFSHFRKMREEPAETEA